MGVEKTLKYVMQWSSRSWEPLFYISIPLICLEVCTTVRAAVTWNASTMKKHAVERIWCNTTSEVNTYIKSMFNITNAIMRHHTPTHAPAQGGRWSQCGVWSCPAGTAPASHSWHLWRALSPGNPGESHRRRGCSGTDSGCERRTAGTRFWPRRTGSSSDQTACWRHL